MYIHTYTICMYAWRPTHPFVLNWCLWPCTRVFKQTRTCVTQSTIKCRRRWANPFLIILALFCLFVFFGDCWIGGRRFWNFLCIALMLNAGIELLHILNGRHSGCAPSWVNTHLFGAFFRRHKFIFCSYSYSEVFA